jgi:hypothetical protein
MATKENIDCDYLLNDGSCQAVSQGKEGKVVRDESCTNIPKNLCCYPLRALQLSRRTLNLGCFEGRSRRGNSENTSRH